MQTDWRDTGELFGVNGHRIGAQEHTPAVNDDDSTILTIIFLPVLIVITMGWWIIRHPATVALIGLVALTWQVFGIIGAAAVVAEALAALVWWRHTWPASFEKWVTDRFRTTAKSWWTYRRRWHSTMALTGLAAKVDGTGYEPAIKTIHCGRYVDRVKVRMLSGQQPEHWDLRCDAFAHTFGALSCRIGDDKPGRIWLNFTHTDSLVAEIPALPIPASVDDVNLAAVQVGLREDGQPWTVRFVGTSASHLLCAGTSGAGKSDLVWAIMRALGPCISAGLVEFRGIDPKGGMEFFRGLPLFSRFAWGAPQKWADLLADTEQLIHDRAERLRKSGARYHVPTVDDPLVGLIIDEIASVTSYLADRQLAKHMINSLSVILSQGRAAGVVVIALVQDPRKDIVPYRDLFPVRIGLRLSEATQVDMILGDGAHKRGAMCERISDTANGTGYVHVDGHRELVRVRSGHIKDPDIDELVNLHPAPLPDIPAEVDDVDVDAELDAILGRQPEQTTDDDLGEQAA